MSHDISERHVEWGFLPLRRTKPKYWSCTESWDSSMLCSTCFEVVPVLSLYHLTDSLNFCFMRPIPLQRTFTVWEYCAQVSYVQLHDSQDSRCIKCICMDLSSYFCDLDIQKSGNLRYNRDVEHSGILLWYSYTVKNWSWHYLNWIPFPMFCW